MNDFIALTVAFVGLFLAVWLMVNCRCQHHLINPLSYICCNCGIGLCELWRRGWRGQYIYSCGDNPLAFAQTYMVRRLKCVWDKYGRLGYEEYTILKPDTPTEIVEHYRSLMLLQGKEYNHAS